MTDQEMLDRLRRYMGTVSCRWDPLRYDTDAHELWEKLRDDGYGVSLWCPEEDENSFALPGVITTACRVELRKGLQKWSVSSLSWRRALCSVALEVVPDESIQFSNTGVVYGGGKPTDPQHGYKEGLVAAVKAVKEMRDDVEQAGERPIGSYDRAVRVIRFKQLDEVIEHLEGMVEDD